MQTKMEFITAPYKTIVTHQQYLNAQTHWNKLIAGQISGEFNMAAYTDIVIVEENNICGTVACSAGYLPETLSLPFQSLHLNRLGKLDYDELVLKYLGIPIHDSPTFSANKSKEWKWCFAGSWEHIDNTAKGAGIRMRILYEQGLPYDSIEQRRDEHILMYIDEL